MQAAAEKSGCITVHPACHVACGVRYVRGAWRVMREAREACGVPRCRACVRTGPAFFSLVPYLGAKLQVLHHVEVAVGLRRCGVAADAVIRELVSE